MLKRDNVSFSADYVRILFEAFFGDEVNDFYNVIDVEKYKCSNRAA